MIQLLVIMAVAIPLLLAAFFMVLAHQSRSGDAIGLVDQRLARCPSSPNCVNSEDPAGSHHVPPLEFPGGSASAAWNILVDVIEASGGRVHTRSDDYLSATFRSSVFGFVDDLECRLNHAAERIEIRSASRVGRSDLGANRKRVEQIRVHFRDRLAAAG